MSFPQDSFDEDQDLSGVEAMVQAAGAFVAPSDDLRPRLLESVRSEQRVARRRRFATTVGVPALLLTTLSIQPLLQARRAINEAAPSQRVARAMASYPAGTAIDRSRGFSWGLVEAFWSVQKQQADAFHGPRDKPSDESHESPRFDAQKGGRSPSE